MPSRSHTTTASARLFSNGSDYAFVALIGAGGFVGGGVWGTGQLAGLLFKFTWPATSFSDSLTIAVALPRHWRDPRLAWPEGVRDDLPGPVGVYTAAVLLLVVIFTVSWFAMRWLGHTRQERGFASRAQLALTLSHTAALATGRRLRPDLPPGKVTLADVAVDLGRAVPSGMPLAATIENSVSLFAAPRAGKTSQIVIPWLRDWTGPALVTSVRADIIENTLPMREDRGPVAILDFTQEHWPHRLRWSHLSGCDQYDTARSRANVLVQVGKDNADSTNAGFFGLTATNLLAGWLHTAAISGKTMDDVVGWALREGDDEPITLLADNPDAHPHVAAMLEGIYAAPSETRSNMWATAMTAIAPLTGSTARDVFCSPVSDSLDIEAYLRRSGTIYIVVSENDAAELAPLLAAFVDEVTTVAKRLGDRSDAGRLSPPLALMLDEVANVVPLPTLPALMSYAGGSGIFVVAVFQSLAQARNRWGREGAQMLWGAATIKIALGGLSGDELDDLSHLAGKYRETVSAISHGPTGYTTSPSLTDRDTITPDEIRALSHQRHEALVIHATTPAVKTRLVPHFKGRHADEHAAAVAATRRLRRPIQETPNDASPNDASPASKDHL